MCSCLIFRKAYHTTYFNSLQIVQEYERVTIFRLGRALRGARGPGLFFIIPCIDNIVTVDMRTVSFDVPPQEVRIILTYLSTYILIYT